jgi:hypothetical protein
VPNLNSLKFQRNKRPLFGFFGQIIATLTLTLIVMHPKSSQSNSIQSDRQSFVLKRNLASENPDFIRDFNGDANQIILNEWLEKAPGSFDKAIIKFVFFIKDDGELDSNPYFLNPNEYPFHWQFINKKNNTQLSFRDIEEVSFKKVGRKYIFGAFMAFNQKLDIDLPVRASFQLSTEELLPLKTLVQIQNSLMQAGVKHSSESSQGLKGLDFVPTGEQKKQIAAIKNELIDSGLPVVLEHDSAQVTYTTSWAIGKMRYLTKSELASHSNQLDKSTVLLIDSEVTDIPQVAAIISTVPLTPASHLVFLAQMYGIPLVFVPEKNKEGSAARIDQIKKMSGSWVFINTDQSTNRFEIVSDLSDVEAQYLANIKAKLRIDLEAFQEEGTEPKVKSVNELSWSDIKTYGAKAVQMGVIFKNLQAQFRHEMAAGISIGFYKNHLKKIEPQVQSLLEKLAANASFNEVTAIATNIQSLILSQKINETDLENIYTALDSQFKNLTTVKNGEKVKLKLRSSSNVEDGEQFNGAGLYDSQGLCFFNCKDGDKFKNKEKIKAKLEETIKFVWASFYNPNAFWARRQFALTNQDELKKIGMGINVNPSVKNEIVNGVASARIVDGDRFEVTVVESKDGDESKETKTQITHGGLEYGITKITSDFSTPAKAFEPQLVRSPQLMPKVRYFELHQQMHILYQVYQKQFPNAHSLTIESEFKLRDHLQPVLIKQVRRVPVNPQIELTNKAKYLILGGNYQFQILLGSESGVGLAQFYAPTHAEIKVPSISSKDLAAGKWKASQINVFGYDKITKKELIETCSNVVPKIVFEGGGSNKHISQLRFPCKAPQLGSLELVFSYGYYDSSSKLRVLNSPLMMAHIELPKTYEAQLLAAAAEKTLFLMTANSAESSILTSDYCMYSEYIENNEETFCSDSVPEALAEASLKNKSQVFFKFQVHPIFGEYDRMISKITSIKLFSRNDKKQWVASGSYETSADFTYVYQALHDGFTQILVDIPNANMELASKLKALNLAHRYLWAPLRGESQFYFLGERSNQKDKLFGMDGVKKTYTKGDDSLDED